MKYIVIRKNTLQKLASAKNETMHGLLNKLISQHSYDVSSAEEFLDKGFSPYVDNLSNEKYYDSVNLAVFEQYAALCVAKDRAKLYIYWFLGYLIVGFITAVAVMYFYK